MKIFIWAIAYIVMFFIGVNVFNYFYVPIVGIIIMLILPCWNLIQFLKRKGILNDFLSKKH